MDVRPVKNVMEDRKMLNVLAGALMGWMSIEDIREKKVSVWPSVCLVVLGILAAAVENKEEPWIHGLGAFLSAAGLGTVLWLAGRISRGSIGTGDAWALGGLGGYLGWQRALTVFFFGLLLCAAAGGLYVRISGKSIKTEMPFLPFLTAAYIVNMIVSCAVEG